MAPEFEPDLYDSLTNDVKNLRDLGKSWGLDDNEIDDCVQRALIVDEKRSMSLHIRWACFCSFGILFSMFFGMSLFVSVVSLHKPTQLFVTKHTQSIAYPLMRGIRLLTLPVARTFDLRGLHQMECLVNNPLFSPGPLDCYPCEHTQQISVFKTLITNFTDEYYNYGELFIAKDPTRELVHFDDLKNLYLANKPTLEYNAQAVECTNSYVTNIEDVLHEDKSVDDIVGSNFALQWRVIKAGSMRLIRGLSPKPYFVPEKGEVAAEMFVFVDSPGAEAHPMPQAYFGNLWLTQGSGSREVTLAPYPNCQQNCTAVSAVLEPGDILFYSSFYWQLSTYPFGDDVSIQFIGSFY